MTESMARRLLLRINPSLLSGLTLSKWGRLLIDNRFDLDRENIPRMLVITVLALNNSLFQKVDNLRFGSQIGKTRIQPPIFVMGAGRSGTTMLQNILCQDHRFAFPNTYQVHFPGTFLTTESIFGGLTRFLLPGSRVQDNVAVGWEKPGEDECALAFMSLMSPFLGLSFPRRFREYQRFLDIAELSEQEQLVWQNAFEWFLRKLTLKYNRPLILKSPAHYSRLKHLLDMFPEARFVHIYRHPFDVMRSTISAAQKVTKHLSMQSSSTVATGDLLWRLEFSYRQFLEQKHLVSPGRLHEVSYEAFYANPRKELMALYEKLDLPDFSVVEGAHERYLNTIAGYQLSRNIDLEESVKKELFSRLRFAFDAWGYQYK